MSVINVVFDNQLKQSEIQVPLKAPSQEYGDNYAELDQVMIHGVCTPVVSICGVVFEFDKVIRMSLFDNSQLPSIYLVVIDDQNQISGLNNSVKNNEVRLQILPPFDDAYKKIDLTFYIKNIEIKRNRVIVEAIYHVPELYISRLKSFGKISNYSLFKTIASECCLGFASNCEANNKDQRFIYCDNISYEELMNREIKMAGGSTEVYDYWVDLWNNINYIDIYKRFTDKDNKEDMEVWCINTPGQTVDSYTKPKPIKTEAVITNHPDLRGELSVLHYNILNNSGNNTEKGTDRVYTMYKNGAYIDTLIEDSNIENNIFTKYYYIGENIGDYEYLSAISCYDTVTDLINKNIIEVTLSFPLLGIYRGSHVKFVWYDNKYLQKQIMKENADNINSEFPNQEQELNDPDSLVINKQVSGEYLVYKTILKYNEGKWNNILILTRPEDQIKSYN